MPNFSIDTEVFMNGVSTGRIPSNLLVGGMVRVKEDVEDQLRALNAIVAEKLSMDGEDDVWAIKIPSGNMNRLSKIGGISFVEMNVPLVRRRVAKEKTQSATGETLGERKGGKLIIYGIGILFVASLIFITKGDWK